MKRLLQGLAVALIGAVFAAGVSQTPRLLRRLDVFRVRRVEVLGTRYMAPETVLAASGITQQTSLFDDPEAWRRRLLRHPMIADVDVKRRPPSTVILNVRETEPVALARTDELQPVDASGRLLPIDPAVRPVDLPVLDFPPDAATGGRLRAQGADALLGVLNRIRRFEPDFAVRISEAGLAADGSIRLRLRDPAGAEVLLPTDLDPVRLRELTTTLEDVDGRGESAQLRRIDGRFRWQIVVSLTPQAS